MFQSRLCRHTASSEGLHCPVTLPATITSASAQAAATSQRHRNQPSRSPVIPPNSLVAGVPGKVRRTIERIDAIHAQALKYKYEWAVGYGVKPDIEGEMYHGEKIV